MRLAGLDPGKHKDSFAEVVCEVANDESKLLVKGAKRWQERLYLDVEKEIASQHVKKAFDKIILEINNTGTHVYEVLRYQHNLPVLPVTTTKDIKDERKKFQLSVMHKNEIVRTALHWQQEGVIVFPKTLTPELEELKRQLSIFAEIKTEAGSVSYRAEGSEHDDLVMALMLVIHYARRVLRLKNNEYQIASHKVGGMDKVDLLGSGVPNYAKAISRSVYYP